MNENSKTYDLHDAKKSLEKRYMKKKCEKSQTQTVLRMCELRRFKLKQSHEMRAQNRQKTHRISHKTARYSIRIIQL